MFDDARVTVVALIAVSIFFLVIYLGAGILHAKRTASTRLTVYGSDALREERLKKPLSERAFAPVVLGIGRGIARFTPIGWIKRTQRRLTLAGISGIDANAWIVIKVLGLIAMLIVAYFFRQGLEVQQQVYGRWPVGCPRVFRTRCLFESAYRGTARFHAQGPSGPARPSRDLG